MRPEGEDALKGIIIINIIFSSSSQHNGTDQNKTHTHTGVLAHGQPFESLKGPCVKLLWAIEAPGRRASTFHAPDGNKQQASKSRVGDGERGE